MKKYKKNDMTTPMASEPGVAYARLTPEHHATCPNGNTINHRYLEIKQKQ